MAIAHFDMAAATSYALRQSSVGDTRLNAATGRTISFALNNNDLFNVTLTGLQSSNAGGAMISAAAASSTVPTLIPDRAQTSTGFSGTTNAIYTVLAGTARVTYSATSGTALFNLDVLTNNANGGAVLNEAAGSTNPTLIPDRSDETTGISGNGSGTLWFVTSGSNKISLGAASLTANVDVICSNANGPALLNEAAGSTNPTLIPDRSDETTGIGANTAEVVTVVSGVERWTVGVGFADLNANFRCDTDLGHTMGAGSRRWASLDAGNVVLYRDSTEFSGSYIVDAQGDTDASANRRAGYFGLGIERTGSASAFQSAAVQGRTGLNSSNNQNLTGFIGVAGFLSQHDDALGATGTVTGHAHYAATNAVYVGTYTNQYGFYSDALSGAINNYVAYLGADSDAQAVIGRVRLGTGSLTADVAYYSHFDNFNTTDYALSQTGPGTTQINCKTGQTIVYSIGGTSGFTMDATNGFYGVNADGPAMTNEAVSTTNPGFCPNRGDLATGIGGHDTANEVTMVSNSTIRVHANSTGLGFFAATPVAKPTVTGSRGGNAALASLLTALANLGLVTDSSS
jgi:hypothetical protein